MVWRRSEQSTWLYSWRRVQEGGVVEGVVGGGEGTKAPHTPLPFSTCILSPHHYIQVTRVAILLYGQAESRRALRMRWYIYAPEAAAVAAAATKIRRYWPAQCDSSESERGHGQMTCGESITWQCVWERSRTPAPALSPAGGHDDLEFLGPAKMSVFHRPVHKSRVYMWSTKRSCGLRL